MTTKRWKVHVIKLGSWRFGWRFGRYRWAWDFDRKWKSVSFCTPFLYVSWGQVMPDD